jgi:ATP-dependent 26S proteasome regulatory subunit
MLELLNQLDGFDSRGDVKVWIVVLKNDCLDIHRMQVQHIY